MQNESRMQDVLVELDQLIAILDDEIGQLSTAIVRRRLEQNLAGIAVAPTPETASPLRPDLQLSWQQRIEQNLNLFAEATTDHAEDGNHDRQQAA